MIDRNTLTGSVNLVGAKGVPLDPDACQARLRSRPRVAALDRAAGFTAGVVR